MTQISDLVSNPGGLANVVEAKIKYNNAIIASGVATTGPEVDVMMTGGQKQVLNHVDKVDTATYNHSTDNYAEKGATGKITATPYIALRQDLNWGWAYADLARIVTKFDANGHAANAIPLFWNEIINGIVRASMLGAVASEADMSFGDGTDAFDLGMIVDAAGVMEQDITTLIVNRATYAQIQKMNIAPSHTNATDALLNVTRVGQYNVIVDKGVPAGTTLIAADGAFAFGTGNSSMVISRDEDGGNGGGAEILRTRLSAVIAPQGFSYIGADKATQTVLANAASWKLAGDLSMVGFRAIKHA